MIFIDVPKIETGAGGYIVRVLKQLQYQEKEGPVVLKVRDGILDNNMTVTTDVFQNITKDGRHLVYNAYVDGPRADWIRAFGFTLSKKPDTNLRCLFWDTDMNPLVSMETKITMEVLPRHFERYALALLSYLICKLYREIIRYRQYLNIYGWNKTIILMHLQFQREV